MSSIYIIILIIGVKFYGARKPHVMEHRLRDTTPGPNSYNIPDSFQKTTKFSFGKTERLIPSKKKENKEYNV